MRTYRIIAVLLFFSAIGIMNVHEQVAAGLCVAGGLAILASAVYHDPDQRNG